MNKGLIIRATFCCCVLFVVFAHASVNADSARNLQQLSDELRGTDARLAQIKDKLAQNTTLKNDLQQTMLAITLKRSERDDRLLELDQNIAQFSSRLDELDDTIQGASRDIANQKSNLANALISAQSIGSNAQLKGLLQHDNPIMAQRLAVLRNYVFRAQNKQLQRTIDYLATVEAARLTALKDRNWLVHIQDKAIAQRDAFAQSEAATEQKILTISNELEQASRTLTQLQQDQQRLQSLMEELERLQRSGSGYFAAFKGQFESPVTGSIAATFGSRKSFGSLRWDGLFISAKSGTEVHAVADGEVVYGDWLEGFGMLVIIDHGDGYMTLYGGNRELFAARGSWVSAGTTIALVGDSGGQTTSGLYFEIRHNAQAVDPLDWLAGDNLQLSTGQM